MKKMLIVLMLVGSSVTGSANASFLGDIGDWVSGAVEHIATDVGKEAEKTYNKARAYGDRDID